MPKTNAKNLQKRSKPGDMDALVIKLWRAVDSAEQLLFKKASTFEEQRSAVAVLVQACQAYGKLLEKSDLEKRIRLLEQSYLEYPLPHSK